MQNYTFSTFNQFAPTGIGQALKTLNSKNLKPIIICIGSDLVLGDSLGPLVGTLLKQKEVSPFVYGTLNYPITAKEVEYATTYLKQLHPNSISIAIDAAVGDEDDVSLIKIADTGIYPGLGVNKKLGKIGDLSIVGVVAKKSTQNYNLYNLTRLNLVYKMADTIAMGIVEYLECIKRTDLIQGFGKII